MKKHLYTYQKIILLLPLLLGLFSSVSYAQGGFEFKVQYMETNDSTWGVYVRPTSGFAPGSNDARTASGQVTLLLPNDGSMITDVVSENGTWNTNVDFVMGPCEAPDISYFFVGLVDGDGIYYEDSVETLLFTFSVDSGCPDSLGLIHNVTDPFVPINSLDPGCATLPGVFNSERIGPGQDLAVRNISTDVVHNWEGNYAPFAYSCADCDGDGIVDAIEDTNGDGVFTMNVDSSAICDVCDPLGINNYSATLYGDEGLEICGAIGEDSVALFVTLTGGWEPFTLLIQDSVSATEIDTITVTNYFSDDTIWVSPSGTSNFRLVNVWDSPPVAGGVDSCVIDQDSLLGMPSVVVHGPISIDLGSGPFPVLACTLDTIGFGVQASNAGEGELLYQWQVSTDDVNWTDIENGTPYSKAHTDSLLISNPLGLDDLYYRAKVFTTACDTIYSMSAQLNVDGPFVINASPQDIDLCATESHVFVADSENEGSGTIQKAWQINEGTGWRDIVENEETFVGSGEQYTQVTTDSLNISNVEGLDGNYYRLRVYSTGNCEDIFTDSARLTVHGILDFDVGGQPEDVTICSDTAACFGVVPTNQASGIVQYQWYVQEPGQPWQALSSSDGQYGGVRSDTLCVNNVAGKDSFLFRVHIFTEECSDVISDEAVLRVDGPIDMVAGFQPEDASVCAEEDMTFFATQTTIGQGGMTTHWQVSTDSGATWTNIALPDARYRFATNTQAFTASTVIDSIYYDTLYVDTAYFNMDGWEYRLAAIGSNSGCDTVFSDPAKLTVEGKIEFTVQPIDISICSDTAACFGITISNEASGILEYQWYVRERGSTTWTPVSNDGTYSGVRSDTMCVTNVLGRDSFLYRVDVRTSDCQIITSDSALLRVDGPIAFATEPTDASVCAVEDPVFFANETTIGQGVMNTRWQVDKQDGNGWIDVDTGADPDFVNASTGLDIDNSTGNPLIEAIYRDTLYFDSVRYYMDGWQFRIASLGANSANCEDVFSREGTLTVEGQLSITVQPDDVELCSDTAACFGVTINNEASGNVRYQWYVKEPGPGATWQVLSSSDGSYGGVRSDTLCVNFITGRDSFLYRVGIRTTDCNEVFSDSALLRVDGPIEFIVDPQDETICAEEDPVYFTSVSTIGQGVMNTRWEVSTDSGATWAPVAGAIYTEVTDVQFYNSLIDSIYYDTLYISQATASMDGYRYRTVAAGDVGSGCEDVESGEAILHVEGRISIVTQPDAVMICSDTAACFGVTVDNETVTGTIQYQWQMQPPGTSTWINLSSAGGLYGGVNSDTMCVNNVAGLDSFLYRVQIFTNTCDIVSSDSAMLNVSGPIDFTAELDDAVVCANEDATRFISQATIGQGGMSTRWQVSTDSGATWTDVDMSIYPAKYSTGSRSEANAATSIDSTYYDTLFIDNTITADMDGWQYRIVANGINGTSCGDIPSNAATLTVHGPFSFIAQPVGDTVCAGKPATIEVNVDNAASGDLRYRWQAYVSGTGWIELLDGVVYNGVTTPRLSISDVADIGAEATDRLAYRVLVSTDNCTPVVSDSVEIHREGPFEFNNLDDHPADTTICVGETVMFDASPSNEGLGDMVFKWQVNIKNRGWGDVDTTASLMSIATGVDTTLLTFTPDAVASQILDSAFFRLAINSTVCNDPTYSLPALLRIDGPLSFTQHPRDTTNCADKGVIFWANVDNPGYRGVDGVNYRWQEYNHDTGIWRDLLNEGVYNGVSTDTLSIDITTGLDSNQYRVVVWTSECNRDTSNTAYVFEEGSVSYSSHPEDVIICSGEATSFFAEMVNSTGQGTNVMNWQLSSNNGITWSNIDPSDPNYNVTSTAPIATGDSTATSASTTLSVIDVTGLGGYRYRAATTSEFCDTVFSQLARLTVEGPFEVNLSGDNDICANIGTTIDAEVINYGSGLPLLQWQFKGPDSTDFSNIPTGWVFSGMTTNGVGTKTLQIDSVLNENSRANLPTGVDTLWSLHGYQFRVAVTSDTCELEVYSDTFTLRVVADTIGRCDWDLDGLDNDTDLDDDNDGLTDSVEVYITTGPGSEPQDSVAQFDTDTDNNGVTDDEEDADEDTISNGEEVDDDDGDGQAEGIDATTGVFWGWPAGTEGGDPVNQYPAYDDEDDVFNGDPLDPCDPILSPSCIGVVLDVNVKLQGAMPGVRNSNNDPAETMMTDLLRQQGLIPATSPYEKFEILDSLGTQVPAFVHIKRDEVEDAVSPEDSTSVFGPMGALSDKDSNAVVDWVFVEIRSGLKLDSVVSTRAALLQRDGDVRDHRPAPSARFADEDGYSYLRFDSTQAGEYYIVVRHRNHLGVMTNEAGLYSPIVTRIDFSDPDFNALGIHPMHMNQDSTEQYLWAGDVTSDRRVIYQGPGNDIDEMFYRAIADPGNIDLLPNYIVSGYYRTDYNMDGLSIFQGPGNDRQMVILNSILEFPDNQVKYLANYVILEQLP